MTQEAHVTRGPLTTEAGAPVADKRNSETAGVGGPVLVQDRLLPEKLAHFNRERIPVGLPPRLQDSGGAWSTRAGRAPTAPSP